MIFGQFWFSLSCKMMGVFLGLGGNSLMCFWFSSCETNLKNQLLGAYFEASSGDQLPYPLLLVLLFWGDHHKEILSQLKFKKECVQVSLPYQKKCKRPSLRSRRCFPAAQKLFPSFLRGKKSLKSCFPRKNKGDQGETTMKEKER